jgi:DNA-binding transcriptional LysR family regulator
MQRPSPPQLEGLRWDDVRLFLALCRSKTVGGAAESLGVDASTVSRRLVAMEELLAATLFDRGRDGIAPTKVAEDLMQVAEEMEQVMMRFTNAAEGLEREVSGLVRITCPPDMAEVVLVPLLRDLLAQHPALRVELDPGETVLDLTRREADLAIRTVRPTRGDLVVTKLMTARWLVAAAPALSRTLGGRMRNWTDAPWIGWGERLSSLRAARWLAKHVKSAVPIVRSDSLMLQLALVATGAGVALVPEPSMKHYGLVSLKPSAQLRAAAAEWPVDEVFLVTHRALRNVPRVHTVWDLLVERLGDRRRRSPAHAE